jgi:hypothetical protein
MEVQRRVSNISNSPSNNLSEKDDGCNYSLPMDQSPDSTELRGLIFIPGTDEKFVN